MRVHIVGAGLIGTSIGLALAQKGEKVSFEDMDQRNLEVARDLIGGALVQSANEGGPIDLILLATPVGAVAESAKAHFGYNPQATFIDIAGLKSEVIQEIEQLPALSERFCGTHPMAGREISGPTGARADLFQGATWIITPTKNTDAEIVQTVGNFVSSLGARVVQVGAQEHDEAIAAVSHMPQIMSSLLATTLSDVSSEQLALAGQGLRDLTRLADSNPVLWSQLISLNSASVLHGLQKVQNEISELVASITSNNRADIEKFFARGNKEKSRIPGKHGGKSRDYAYLPIVIDDKPGQLAAIFNECATVGVNVEDLFIEHSPGQETGLITLALSNDGAEILRSHLTQQNWRVHAIRAQR